MSRSARPFCVKAESCSAEESQQIGWSWPNAHAFESLTFLILRLWNFFVVMITPTLITSLAWKGYLIFMALNFSFVPLVYFCYPETANLTLEAMDELFSPSDEGAVKMSVRVAKHGWGDRLGKFEHRGELGGVEPKSGLGNVFEEQRVEGDEKEKAIKRQKG